MICHEQAIEFGNMAEIMKFEYEQDACSSGFNTEIIFVKVPAIDALNILLSLFPPYSLVIYLC